MTYFFQAFKRPFFRSNRIKLENIGTKPLSPIYEKIKKQNDGNPHENHPAAVCIFNRSWNNKVKGRKLNLEI